jgi:two-component system response regulator FlrC
VRELANALERAAIVSGGDRITPKDLVVGPGVPSSQSGRGARSLEEIERDAIHRALAAQGGNRRAAAEQLGIGLRTLYEKLKRYQEG